MTECVKIQIHDTNTDYESMLFNALSGGQTIAVPAVL